MILDIPFVVAEVTFDPIHYDLATARLMRQDEIAGWLRITGPGVELFKIGDEIVIRKGENPNLIKENRP